MIPIVLDSGALSAWAERDQAVVTLLEGVRRTGGISVVPTVVLAESTTGEPGRDARVNRQLKGCVIDPCHERRGRRAAALRYASGAAGDISVVDAVVAATGEAFDGPVLTGDPADLRRLTARMRVEILDLNELG